MNLEIVRFTAEFSTSHEGVGRTLLDDLIKRIYCEMAPVDVYLYRAQQLGDGVTHFPVIIGEVAVEDSHNNTVLHELSRQISVQIHRVLPNSAVEVTWSLVGPAHLLTSWQST